MSDGSVQYTDAGSNVLWRLPAPTGVPKGANVGFMFCVLDSGVLQLNRTDTGEVLWAQAAQRSSGSTAPYHLIIAQGSLQVGSRGH